VQAEAEAAEKVPIEPRKSANFTVTAKIRRMREPHTRPAPPFCHRIRTSRESHLLLRLGLRRNLRLSRRLGTTPRPVEPITETRQYSLLWAKMGGHEKMRQVVRYRRTVILETPIALAISSSVSPFLRSF
jgi:hypothetical protein